MEELSSLVDESQSSPALPTGHKFDNVQSTGAYCSSTTYEGNTSYAWSVGMGNGVVGESTKASLNYVWPVRGGI